MSVSSTIPKEKEDLLVISVCVRVCVREREREREREGGGRERATDRQTDGLSVWERARDREHVCDKDKEYF